MFAFFRFPARLLPVAAPMFFALILINLACSAFFTFYLLKDNNRSLDPRWVSEGSYQSLRTTTASSFKTADGQTVELRSNPVERNKIAGSYQLTTPDGRWRGSIAADLSTYTMIAWLNAAVPVISICVVGLFFTWPGRKEPSLAGLKPELLSSSPLQIV